MRRSFSRSSLILLASGARLESLASVTRTFFSPVAASTYHSSPCSPASSRWTNETLEPSGLHLMVSGARPVSPPSAKMDSIVSGFFGGLEGFCEDAGEASKPNPRAAQKIVFKGRLRTEDRLNCRLKSVHRAAIVCRERKVLWMLWAPAGLDGVGIFRGC